LIKKSIFKRFYHAKFYSSFTIPEKPEVSIDKYSVTLFSGGFTVRSAMKLQ